MKRTYRGLRPRSHYAQGWPCGALYGASPQTPLHAFLKTISSPLRRGRPGGGRVFLALLSAIFVSCAGFDALEVAAWNPSHQEYGVPRDADIWMEFSADVRKSSIEESFSLRADSGKIGGQFQWITGRKFIFIPFDSLETGGRYVMELPRSVEDSDGNTMEEDFISEFYVGDDTVKPRVISSDPPWTEGGATGIDTGIAGIEVLFSEPMDAMTAESAFSISPDIPGYFTWSDGGARLTYVLTSPLDYGTQYRVTVASSAEDATGNSLEGSYTIVFITGDDFVQPQVAGAWENGMAPPPYWDTDTVNPGVSRNSLISIEFSESMKRSSTESAFTITPSTSGCFRWSSGDSVLTFEPEDPLDSDTVYTLRIGTSAEDVHGLRLKDPYAVSFRTDNPDSQHVRATFMRGSCNDGAAPCPYEDLYDGVTLNWPLMIDMGAIAGQPEAYDYYFQVTFGNHSGPAEMNLYSLLDNIIIEGGDTPHLVNVALSPDKTAATLLFDGLSNSEDLTPNLYRVTIAGGESGIRDINGNTMERDFVFEFKDRLP